VWLAVSTAALVPALASTDHSQHAATEAGLRRAEVQLQMPAVAVQRQDGQKQDFRRMLDDGRPVMLNFIYTSCTAICPVTAQVFREVRERLGKDRDQVHVVSVSIDPEYDTPARLATYAQRFSEDSKWTFVTAARDDAVAIQKAFKAYQGDKMNHLPVTFVRSAPGKPWVRLDGFASPKILVAEVKDAMASWRQASSSKSTAASAVAPLGAPR
jgi:protein SCO1/2